MSALNQTREQMNAIYGPTPRTRQHRLRASLGRAIIALLPLVLTAAVIRRIRIAAGMRRGDQVVIDAKRARNKRFANRLITTVGRAGRRHSIFAILRFVGRRTGRRYSTPIRLVEHGDGFIVPLTYGSRTSWYLNLLANPGELQWQGQTIPVGNPTLVPTRAVAHLLPPPSRFLMWLDGTDTCVRLEHMVQPANMTSNGGHL
jgi:deazaflavin-dependent oxidoreductase (nitroreductase family)